MMQPGDRHEGAVGRAIEQRSGGIQRGADHSAGRLEAATERGRVATIQRPVSCQGTLAYEVHVALGVESSQFRFAGLARTAQRAAPVQAPGTEFAQEGSLAIGAKGMTIGESVAAQRLIGHHQHAAVRPSRSCARQLA